MTDVNSLTRDTPENLSVRESSWSKSSSKQVCSSPRSSTGQIPSEAWLEGLTAAVGLTVAVTDKGHGPSLRTRPEGRGARHTCLRRPRPACQPRPPPQQGRGCSARDITVPATAIGTHGRTSAALNIRTHRTGATRRQRVMRGIRENLVHGRILFLILESLLCKMC